MSEMSHQQLESCCNRFDALEYDVPRKQRKHQRSVQLVLLERQYSVRKWVGMMSSAVKSEDPFQIPLRNGQPESYTHLPFPSSTKRPSYNHKASAQRPKQMTMQPHTHTSTASNATHGRCGGRAHAGARTHHPGNINVKSCKRANVPYQTRANATIAWHVSSAFCAGPRRQS